MKEPRFIPEHAGSQAMVTDNPNGSVSLTVHTAYSHSSMSLSPPQALELADELRFRALSMQAEVVEAKP